MCGQGPTELNIGLGSVRFGSICEILTASRCFPLCSHGTKSLRDRLAEGVPHLRER